MSTTSLQRTDQWYVDKLGRVGSSRIGDLMATTKTGYGSSRGNYMAELLCERLTGQTYNGYFSKEMQWGIDQEPAAKAAYCFMRDAAIDEIGFVLHPKIDDAGASPDGLVGDDGLVEIKCPNTATHIETLLTQVVERKYMLQMQFQMACTGRQWCDFVSFDPRLPPAMQLWVKRYDRATPIIEEIEYEVCKFLVELESKFQALKKSFPDG
jgi:hypothetical protein